MVYSQPDESAKPIRFEDIKEGFEAEITHTVTLEDVQSFAELTGDFNPVHTDKKFARRTSFGRPIVHGMLTSSFISTMIGMRIPGPGALWVSQTIEFQNPTFVGDEIKVVARVKRKSVSTRLLVLEMTITNQNGTKLVTGESTVRVLALNEEEREQIMQKSEDSQVILVTGGSRGIGASIAKRLAAEGHAVVINYFKAETEAQELVDAIVAQDGKAVAVKGDVARLEDVESLFSVIYHDSVPFCSKPLCN